MNYLGMLARHFGCKLVRLQQKGSSIHPNFAQPYVLAIWVRLVRGVRGVL